MSKDCNSFEWHTELFLVVFKARASAPLSSNFSFSGSNHQKCPDVRISLGNNYCNLFDYFEIIILISLTKIWNFSFNLFDARALKSLKDLIFSLVFKSEWVFVFSQNVLFILQVNCVNKTHCYSRGLKIILE